jgi:hypothetical protein
MYYFWEQVEELAGLVEIVNDELLILFNYLLMYYFLLKYRLKN